MAVPLRVALVITTYQNPEFLGICLRSLLAQTHSQFHVFISDDGSDQRTRDKVDSLRPLFKNGIQHCWHEDTGYNKAKINNLVFRELESFDVVINIDGDTAAHPRFVEDHYHIHEKHKNLLFMGRRVELGPEITKGLTEENIVRFVARPSLPLLWSAVRRDTQGAGRSVRISHPLLQHLLNRDDVVDILGSNFSISRELLFRVNGYNEDYQSYWGEDGDLFVRVRNSGAKVLGLKSYAIQFHLFHTRREPTPEHVSRYEKILSQRDYVRCSNGIVKST